MTHAQFDPDTHNPYGDAPIGGATRSIHLPSEALWFGCGVLAGALAGILFAPARGRDTRREIVWTAREARTRASKLAGSGRRAVKRQRDRVDGIVRAAESRLRTAGESVMRAADDATSAFERGKTDALAR